jgi:very-short-patch-repair endonuclease
MESILLEILESRLSEMPKNEIGYYKLNELDEGGDKVGCFLENSTTKNLIALIDKMLKKPSVISKAGRYGGTWAHRDIAISFIMNTHQFPNYKFKSDELCFAEALSKIFGEVLTIERQKQFGSYFVDIYIKQLNLVIEHDEEYHNKAIQKELDAARDRYLIKEHKVTVLRFNSKSDDMYKLFGDIALGVQEYTKNTMRLVQAFL